jgi:hypothetical protein
VQTVVSRSALRGPVLLRILRRVPRHHPHRLTHTLASLHRFSFVVDGLTSALLCSSRSRRARRRPRPAPRVSTLPLLKLRPASGAASASASASTSTSAGAGARVHRGARDGSVLLVWYARLLLEDVGEGGHHVLPRLRVRLRMRVYAAHPRVQLLSVLSRHLLLLTLLLMLPLPLPPLLLLLLLIRLLLLLLLRRRRHLLNHLQLGKLLLLSGARC